MHLNTKSEIKSGHLKIFRYFKFTHAIKTAGYKPSEELKKFEFLKVILCYGEIKRRIRLILKKIIKSSLINLF